MTEVRIKLSDMQIMRTPPDVELPPEMRKTLEKLMAECLAEVEAAMWGTAMNPRPTALRWTEGGGFETVYLDEPDRPRCTCRGVVHWHGCPLYPAT